MQCAGHAAYVDLGPFAGISASPELFFAKDGPIITMKPMKGTAPRGVSPEADHEHARALGAAPKTRAENLMIVDMLRSDLGRLAVTGSVSVPRLFDVERYPTLLQMTSTVAAQTAMSLGNTLANLLAPASVTGAPKRRTMEIIAELEPCARGIYTGTLGWGGPDGTARFNVAIRTAVVDRTNGTARYGVGSGIVADSVASEEYAECLLKARILTEAPFALLETMRGEPGRESSTSTRTFGGLRRGRLTGASPLPRTSCAPPLSSERGRCGTSARCGCLWISTALSASK